MRRAPHHPGRFTPSLRPLEGRVVLSHATGMEPAIASLAEAALLTAEFEELNEDSVGHTPYDLPSPDSADGFQVEPRHGRGGFARISADLAADAGGFAIHGVNLAELGSPGRYELSPWRAWGRPPRSASVLDETSETATFGPPAPEPADAQSSSLAMNSPTSGPRGAGARGGPDARPGPGPSPSQPKGIPSGPGVTMPRGPFSPRAFIEAASPPAPPTPTPVAPGAGPTLAPPGTPDLARPLAVTNVAGIATVASLGLGASTGAEDRAVGTPATSRTVGDVPLAASAPPPGDAPPPTVSGPGDAVAAEGEDRSDPPGPIGSGVLQAFLPLDRATVDLALQRVLGQLDDLGSPLAGPSSRIPMVIPAAAALAAAEAARRWRARRASLGPSIARGSRFSSLRGLS